MMPGVGRGEKIGSGKVRFVMSGRDVFLIAPHTGPSTSRPRDHRERDAFARDAAARCDGRRAPGEADRLHQAELREKRRASQTSARGKLPSKRVGEKRAPRREARGNHRREWEAAGSQRAVPIRRDVHHDPHRGRLRLRPLGTSVRNCATPRPRRKSRAERRNGRRLVPLACRFFFQGVGFFFCETMFFARGERTALTDAPRYPAVMLLVLSAWSLKVAFLASAAVDHVVAQTAAFSGADVLLRGALAAPPRRGATHARRCSNRNSGGDLGDGHLGCSAARGDGGTAR